MCVKLMQCACRVVRAVHDPTAMGAALHDLATTIHSGEAMLFTGAGFSADARDREGNRLPDSAEMAAELWAILFGEGEPDASSLPDLYDVALMRAPEALRAYLERRLRIGDGPLPRHYAQWFSAPWRRIYTLNVDDLEGAVARQFALPRRLRSISALEASELPASEGALDVVHLNGMAGSAAHELTFSTMQYASRLCARDREYERLVGDLARAPFVFAGTTLDEVILFQHLELQKQKRGMEPERSFLISPNLTRARQVLLENLKIQWIQGTIADVAAEILGPHGHGVRPR